MAKAKTPRLVRVVLLDEHGLRATDSIWARAQGGGFELLFDYPDMKPAAGWRVESDSKTYRVDAVSGKALQCSEVTA